MSAEDETYEERLKKFIFPENLLVEAEKIVERVKKERPKEADIAEKELKKAVDNIVAAFRDKEGFEDKIEEVAKKKNISKDRAAIQLKRHEEAMAKGTIDSFIMSWLDVLRRRGTKREKSPLGNKHHTEYDRMGKFVEDHLPDLFKLAPPDEEPEEPTDGIPTPKEIREEIERKWTMEREPTPEEIAKWYRIEGDEMGFGGGGKGGKRKHRQKPAKAPVPSGTYEQIKDDLGKLITHKTPQQVVLTIMAIYVKRVRDSIKNLKEGEYIDVGEIIDGFVWLLKHTQNIIVNLNTHPSTRTLESPSKALGAPSFSGTPDIPIDSYKEAMDLFDKVKGIYDEINHYIAPDTVKNVHKPESRRYLPRGLGEWLEWYTKQKVKIVPKGAPKEEAPKTSGVIDYSCQMSFDVARKFAGVELLEDFEAILR
jgi:hypothetical protein